MINLKTYEAFEQSDYYEEITALEYINQHKRDEIDKRIPINDKLLEYIQNNISDDFKIEQMYLVDKSLKLDIPAWLYMNIKSIKSRDLPEFKFKTTIYDPIQLEPIVKYSRYLVTKLELFITNFQDEWYYVHLSGKPTTGPNFVETHYKCDQVTGLTRLLKDLKIIK